MHYKNYETKIQLNEDNILSLPNLNYTKTINIQPKMNFAT